MSRFTWIGVLSLSILGSAPAATIRTDDTQVRVTVRHHLVDIAFADRRGRVWGTSNLTAWLVPRTGRWRFAGCQASANRIVVSLVCDQPALTATSTWQAYPGPGPVEHMLQIANRGPNSVLLPLQSSLRLQYRNSGMNQWWVEKSGGHASPVGLHVGPPGTLFSTPYADDRAHLDAIPWTAMQGVGSGWYAGIEFSGRVHMSLRDGQADFGLTPEPGWRTRLGPGETFEAPPVFVGCYQGDVDDGANRLRHWTLRHLRPPVAGGPLLTNNSWGSGMAVDDPLARTMIEESADLGLEMFDIDAGWFRTVGDWRPDPVKFPHGLAPVANYAHQHGLRLGLWVGWTQGGIGPQAQDPLVILNVHSRPDWFTHPYPAAWKPSDFTGADVCLGNPRVVDWCLGLLTRLVRDNHVDMLEHDQRMVVDRCDRTDHLHTPWDVPYRAAQGYYQVYDRLRARFPTLRFENCVNGGRMVDYGAARRAHYFSISDAYDPLSNRQAFYDASFALPPSMCECYIQQEPVHSLAEFVSMLRSGMMGWCTVMCNTAAWSPAEHQAAHRQFELYKQVLRPLINGGDLFHVSPRPDGIHWDGIQYSDGDHSVLFAFRGTLNESSHTFRLRGLDPKAHYVVSAADGDDSHQTRTGADLMLGTTVHLDAPGTSQIILLYKEDS